MSKHQKRLSAPRNYAVKRKDGSYVVRSQGPHPDSEGVPLAVVLRDVLGYADTMDEAKALLAKGKVLVNGRTVRNQRSNLGFMDVLSFPDIDEAYRILVTTEGFVLKPIDDGDAGKKLVRIDGKTTLKGGVTQLNLHDGNNVETGESFETGSSVLVTLPDMEIEEEFGFEEGNLAYIIGGKHTGETATVTAVNVQPGSQANTVTLESDGETFETREANVYIVGEEEPVLEVERGE